jgi:hypothetical protein
MVVVEERHEKVGSNMRITFPLVDVSFLGRHAAKSYAHILLYISYITNMRLPFHPSMYVHIHRYVFRQHQLRNVSCFQWIIGSCTCCRYRLTTLSRKILPELQTRAYRWGSNPSWPCSHFVSTNASTHDCIERNNAVRSSAELSRDQSNGYNRRSKFKFLTAEGNTRMSFVVSGLHDLKRRRRMYICSGRAPLASGIAAARG